MARLKDREKAIALRKKGMSYSQIKKRLKIAKSTLSIWLKNYPLSPERIRELQFNEKKIERYRNTMRKKKEARLRNFYEEQKNLILPFSKKELYLAGIFLYWGEGTKYSQSIVSLSNTDPAVIKFFLFWLTHALNIPRTKVRIQLQLYNDMDAQKEIGYWANILSISKEQFARPYIKNSSSIRINHKGSFGHGTCGIRIGDVRLAERIMMAIKAITKKYAYLRV